MLVSFHTTITVFLQRADQCEKVIVGHLAPALERDLAARSFFQEIYSTNEERRYCLWPVQAYLVYFNLFGFKCCMLVTYARL